MVVNNIQFNKAGVKSLTLAEFKQLYGGKLKQKTEDTYYKITGFKKPTKKEVKKDKAED